LLAQDEFVFPSLAKVLSFVAPNPHPHGATGNAIHGLSLGSIPVQGTKGGFKMAAGTAVADSMVADFEAAIRQHNISGVTLASNADGTPKPTCLGGKNPKKCVGYRGHRKILLNTVGACTIGTHHFAMGSPGSCGSTIKKELNTDDAHLVHFRGLGAYKKEGVPYQGGPVGSACDHYRQVIT